MLLQRVTRKSLYRFRTSFGGSSSAGDLWQHFVMRIRLIPNKRNQKNEKKGGKITTAHHIKHTPLTRNTVLHITTIPTLHATPTHTTLTYSTLPHCITSHTLLPLSHRYMLHQHAYTNTCYTFTLHSTHHLESTGVLILITHVIFYYAQKTYIQDLYATPPPAPLLNIQYPTIKRRNLPYLISPKQQTQSHTCHAYSRARPHNAPAS